VGLDTDRPVVVTGDTVQSPGEATDEAAGEATG
jgi:hypothetical protein